MCWQGGAPEAVAEAFGDLGGVLALLRAASALAWRDRKVREWRDTGIVAAGNLGGVVVGGA